MPKHSLQTIMRELKSTTVVSSWMMIAIGERPITIDVLGMLHFGDFAVYCKYSPMSVLKKDKGPDFKSLAVGFYF